MWSARRSWVFCSIVSTFWSRLRLEPTRLWWNNSRVLLQWCKENTHWSTQIGWVGFGIQSRILHLWATQWFLKSFKFFPRKDSLLNCFMYFLCIFLNIIYFFYFLSYILVDSLSFISSIHSFCCFSFILYTYDFSFISVIPINVQLIHLSNLFLNIRFYFFWNFLRSFICIFVFFLFFSFLFLFLYRLPTANFFLSFLPSLFVSQFLFFPLFFHLFLSAIFSNKWIHEWKNKTLLLYKDNWYIRKKAAFVLWCRHPTSLGLRFLCNKVLNHGSTRNHFKHQKTYPIGHTFFQRIWIYPH